MESQIVGVACEYEGLTPWKGYSNKAIGFLGETDDLSLMDMKESLQEALLDLSNSAQGQEVCKPCDLTSLRVEHTRDLKEWLHGYVYETLVKNYVREQVSPDFDFEQVEDTVAKVAASIEKYDAKQKNETEAGGESSGWSISGLYQSIADDFASPENEVAPLENTEEVSNASESGGGAFDQVKDFALTFLDGEGEGGQQVTDYANVVMERAVQFATTVSQAVTTAVLALAKVGEAAKTYLVFSGIVLLILSVPGEEYAPAAFILDCLLFRGRQRGMMHSEMMGSLESIFVTRARAAAFFFLWTWFTIRLSGAHILVTSLPWALIAAVGAAVQLFPVYVGVFPAVVALLASGQWPIGVALMIGSLFSSSQFLAVFRGKSTDGFLKSVVTAGGVAIMGLPGAILGPSLLETVRLCLKMWYVMIEDVMRTLEPASNASDSSSNTNSSAANASNPRSRSQVMVSRIRSAAKEEALK